MKFEKQLVIELTEEETTAYHAFLKATGEDFKRRLTREEIEEYCETIGSQQVTLTVSFHELGTTITVGYLGEETTIRDY